MSLRSVCVTAVLALLLAHAAAAAAPAQACVGDCNGDSRVTVDEIVTLVSLALTTGTAGCAAGDANADDTITVDEIVRAGNHALTGCPDPGPRITLAEARGAPGAEVVVAAALAGAANRLFAASIDIAYDPRQVAVRRSGAEPDCSIDPSLGPASASRKQLLLAILPGRDGREILRVGLLSFTTVRSIPDGPLFTCRFTIDAAAADGVVLLDGVADGADAIGTTIAVGSPGGRIVVAR